VCNPILFYKEKNAFNLQTFLCFLKWKFEHVKISMKANLHAYFKLDPHVYILFKLDLHAYIFELIF
jgi:hypothetical protein